MNPVVFQEAVLRVLAESPDLPAAVEGLRRIEGFPAADVRMVEVAREVVRRWARREEVGDGGG